MNRSTVFRFWSFLIFLLFAVSVSSAEKEEKTNIRFPITLETANASFEEMRPFAQLLLEISERRRRTVYIPNYQKIFNGININFVNVGKGNLTFQRRDIVSIDKIPIVVSRIYDSSSSTGDFGPAWALGIGEEILVISPDLIDYRDESGSHTKFKKTRVGYTAVTPHPTDVYSFNKIGPDFVVQMKTGLSKSFSRDGDRYVLRRVTDQYNNFIEFRYQQGRLSNITSTNGRSISILRNSQNYISSIHDELGRTVRYQYDDLGRLKSVFDLGNNLWTYEYQRISSYLTAALGPKKEIDIAAIYDSQKVSEIFVRGISTQFEYDEYLNVTAVTDANGGISKYEQDSNGITVKVVNTVGRTSSIVLDRKNRVRLLRTDGTVYARFKYRNDGLLRQSYVMGEFGYEKNKFSYDKNGRLTAVKSSNDENVTEVKYQENNQRLDVTKAGNRETYSFSDTGSLIGFESENKKYDFSPNRFGLPGHVRTDALTILRLDYYNSGRLENASFANGEKQSYTYDNVGTRKTLTHPLKQDVEYLYSPSGSLEHVFNRLPDGRSNETHYVLDDAQRLTKIISDPASFSLEYDESGRLVKLIGSDPVLEFGYDKLGRFTNVKGGGESLTYRYQNGERNIVEAIDTFTDVGLSGNVISGMTFGGLYDVVLSRSIPSAYQAVHFDKNLREFRVLGEFGITLPNRSYKSAIERMRITSSSKTSSHPSDSFSSPSNVFFIPPEFWAINCNVCPPSDPMSVPINPTLEVRSTRMTLSIKKLTASIAACGGGGETICLLSMFGAPQHLCVGKTTTLFAIVIPTVLDEDLITWSQNGFSFTFPSGTIGPITTVKAISEANSKVTANLTSGSYLCSASRTIPTIKNKRTVFDELLSSSTCPEKQQESSLNYFDIDGCSTPTGQNPTGDLFVNPGTSAAFGSVQGHVPYGTTPANLPCNNHDVCYQTCNSNKTTCDNQFGTNMTAVCSNAFSGPCPFSLPLQCILRTEALQTCAISTAAYQLTVSIVGGVLAYRPRQLEYCDCCPP